jgi:hypothetical protein
MTSFGASPADDHICEIKQRNPMKSSSTRALPLAQNITLTIAAGAVAMLSLTTAHAAENRGQRYSAGVGGSDMTSMLVPGWYGQVAMLHYHATKLKGNDGKDVSTLAAGSGGTAGQVGAGLAAFGLNPTQQQGVANALTAAGYSGTGYQTKLRNFRADGYAILPRITYVSSKQVLGGNLGFTAMLPLIKRQTSLAADTTLSSSNLATLTGTLSGIPAIGPTGAAAVAGNVSTGIYNQTAAGIAARNGSNAGIGDLEVSPVVHWEIGDNQSVTLAPTLILPTGEYNKSKAVNPGFGKFYTFRPSIQYGFIGDGWDVGARAVLSFNTRNKDTKYRSGNMLNIDFEAMKFVSEDVRVGLQGYVVRQLSDDSSEIAADQAGIDATDGNKMRVYALGPAVAWLKNGGEMLVEGKVLKEFSARNRTEGTAYWLTISKPLGN